MKRLFFAAVAACFSLLATTVSAQPPHRGPGERSMNPEQMAQRRTEQLTKQLSLNKEQAEEVYQLQLNRMQQMGQMRRQMQGEQVDREQMRAKMQQAHAAEQAEMQRILNEGQYKKWQQMEAERAQRHGGPRGKKGASHPGKGEHPATK